MRVSMKLDYTSNLLLNQMINEYNTKTGLNVNRGFMVNLIMMNISEKYDMFDWDYISKLVINSDKSTVVHSTKLNLSYEVVDIVETIKKDFKNIFPNREIHFAFVIKQCIKARYLLSDKELSKKIIKDKE